MIDSSCGLSVLAGVRAITNGSARATPIHINHHAHVWGTRTPTLPELSVMFDTFPMYNVSGTHAVARIEEMARRYGYKDDCLGLA